MINMILYTLIDKLREVDMDNKEQSYGTQVEHELRMILNVTMNFIIYNNDDPSMIKEITDKNLSSLEEICMKAVRISLELAIVPIRKFLILFLIYMRYLFGREVIPPVDDPKAKMYYES